MNNPLPLDKLIRLLTATGCLALVVAVLAVDPPPDGGYPGRNTAEGKDALFTLTNGKFNTAIGFQTLFSMNQGQDCTAIGATALRNSVGCINNTAIGSRAMFSNQGGGSNTAIGQTALYSNTFGGGNTAIGTGAMYFNTNGVSNTATGFEALHDNTEGQYNTATGNGALAQNSTGNFNTASGASALLLNTTGGNNAAIGLAALASNTTGSFNIALGANAGTNLTMGSNNIDIANAGVAGESNTVRIGTQETQTATYVAGISGATVAGGVAVVIDTNGHLGTTTSSARYKEAIKPMDKASEAIHALKPVTFRYKKDLDPEGIPQYGLVAEEVEKVNPDLVACDADGKAYTVRYEAVNAMLLNEFLKEHRKNEVQQKQIEALTAIVKEQAAQIQKVSDQMQMNLPGSQLVANDR